MRGNYTSNVPGATAQYTPSSVYKELAYKEFFWPVLKVLADLKRKLSTESFCGKEFLKTEKPKPPQTLEFQIKSRNFC